MFTVVDQTIFCEYLNLKFMYSKPEYDALIKGF